MSRGTEPQESLEDGVRRHLAAAVRDAEPGPDLWSGVQRGIVRRRRSMILARMATVVTLMAVSAGALLWLATGYRGSHPTPETSRTPSVVPWIAVSPPGPPAASPLDLPPCRARDLTATVFTEGATEHAAGVLQFVNRSERSCVLRGTPMIKLFDGRTPLDVGVTEGTGRPVPGAGPALVPPGTSAYTEFEWSNWCGSQVRMIRVAVTLPSGGGTIVATRSPNGFLVPPCDSPGHPSGAWVGSFYALPKPSPLSRLDIRIHPPAPVAAGSSLRYWITFSNTSDRAVPLRPCPTYREVLESAPAPVVKRYVLNCDSVGGIPVGGSVAFAMALHVPAGTHPGPAKLTWYLEPKGSGPIQATVATIR